MSFAEPKIAIDATYRRSASDAVGLYLNSMRSALWRMLAGIRFS